MNQGEDLLARKAGITGSFRAGSLHDVCCERAEEIWRSAKLMKGGTRKEY